MSALTIFVSGNECHDNGDRGYSQRIEHKIIDEYCQISLKGGLGITETLQHHAVKKEKEHVNTNLKEKTVLLIFVCHYCKYYKILKK